MGKYAEKTRIELGWSKSDEAYAPLTGKTIAKVTFITTEAIYEITADVAVPDIMYVLMNIPYNEFYQGEKVTNTVDAVSSATKMKSRTGTLAGGSYHVDPEGSDISGIIYPVKVQPQDLEGKKQITDEDSVSIEVTNRGTTSTTTYSGKEALFEAPSYSYYILNEKPKGYKVLQNGSFSAVKGLKAKDTASLTEGASAALKDNPGHADYEISISGFTLPEGEFLRGALLSTEDGSVYGLSHVANIWRNGLELGWNVFDRGFEDLAGKTIIKITYFTDKAQYDLNVKIPTEVTRYVLMNIPYSEFYAAELAAVFLTDTEGKTYPLRHIQNLWRNMEFGWNAEEFDLSGKTIQSITYITQKSKTIYTVNLKVPVCYSEPVTAVFAESMDQISLKGLPEDLSNGKVSVYYTENRQSVFLAEDAVLETGAAVLTEKAETGREYSVKVTSDNYAAILCSAKTTDISKGVLTLSKTSLAFTGKQQKPSVTVTLEDAVVSSEYYTVKYANNTNIGTATVTVTGKDGYTGSLSTTFKIVKNASAVNQLNAKLTAAFRKNSLKITWGKVTDASGYEVYVAKKGSSYPSKATKVISKNSTTSLTLSRLGGKKITASDDLMVTVYAYNKVSKTRVRIAGSLEVSASGSSSKYTNPKKVTAKKSAVTITAGKKKALSFTISKVNGKKKLPSAKLRYWSTNTGIAKVDKNGNVTGVKKGTCYVYAMAVNGAKAKVKITVK